MLISGGIPIRVYNAAAPISIMPNPPTVRGIIASIYVIGTMNKKYFSPMSAPSDIEIKYMRDMCRNHMLILNKMLISMIRLFFFNLFRLPEKFPEM